MSEPNPSSSGIDATGLRERLPQNPDAPQKAESVETSQHAVRALNEQEAKEDKDEKDKKTYGRTPDGTGAYLITNIIPPSVEQIQMKRTTARTTARRGANEVICGDEEEEAVG